MGASIDRLRRAREARRTLEELAKRAANTLVVHYSCETFYERADGKTPRITSIAVRNWGSGQTRSFSIHKVAELRKIDSVSIPAKYDLLEKEMLSEFFDFVRTHEGFSWVHWNMRDQTFGFAALEHRFQVLGGDPVAVPDSAKVDLARLVPTIYGKAYAAHPRMHDLATFNGFTLRDFLLGEQEAEAFRDGDYFRLHLSTLRKADVIAEVLERASEGTLRTRTKWYHTHGASLEAAGEFVKEHWAFSLLALLLGIIGLFWRP